MMRRMHFSALGLAAAVALASCADTETEETSYEVDATDVGGGELIVRDEDPNAVPVELPETPMTNVPPDEGTAPDESTGPDETG